MSSPPRRSAEFVPEKISLNRAARRPGRRRGAGKDGGNASSGGSDGNYRPHPSAIASSVVFHEDVDVDPDSRDAGAAAAGGTGGLGAAGQQHALFDEIDALDPHGHEGGRIASDPHRPPTFGGGGAGRVNKRSTQSSSLSSSNKSIAESILHSLKNSSLFHGDERVPADVESLVARSNDGTLAQLIAGMEDRLRASANNRSLTQDMDVWGSDRSGNTSDRNENVSRRKKHDSGREDGTLDQLIAGIEDRYRASANSMSHSLTDVANIMGSDRNSSSSSSTQENIESRRESIVGGSPATPDRDCVDWYSLSKSCKRAKNAFRDADAGHLVVKNMFLTHLGAMISVLERYCGSNDLSDSSMSQNEIKARTTETKRALRFAITCLVPPRLDKESKSTQGDCGESPEGKNSVTPTGSSDEQDDIEAYRFARKYRQELQEAAVKGSTLRSASPTKDGEISQQRESRHYGLQLPLVEIIISDRVLAEEGADGAKDESACVRSSIERDRCTIRVLATRLLCNLVTDNPLAAEVVLGDVPFSPTPDEINRRMSGLILGPGGCAGPCEDEPIYWYDLFDATARAGRADASGTGEGADDRDALAAVAVALHNLMTSLEARESLLELDDEMKRRENMRQFEESLDRPLKRLSTVDEIGSTRNLTRHMDVGFEVASNGLLMNALLRNILPAKAVFMQSKFEKERATTSRPKFRAPSSSSIDDDMADSATEWISLILERLASRGLLPRMFHTTGGPSSSVTPEHAVLTSCVRQAVDDYHSALTPSGHEGGFGRGRLSIAAREAGVAVATRPHPLWGRAGGGAGGKDSRTAVPVLLSLANEAEEVRRRADALREGRSNEVYDGERDCAVRIVDDLCDILAQSLGRHSSSGTAAADNQRGQLCSIADARSVLGRETSIVASCCKDLARLLDAALASNSVRMVHEMELSPQDKQTAIVMVRLIANIIFQCRYNQDLLRITPIPLMQMANGVPASSNSAASPNERTGLHVILSATSLAPTCFSLREWCKVAIRNAVEGNAANAETVSRLEAIQVLGDTPVLCP